jgi:hypothetical protein
MMIGMQTETLVGLMGFSGAVVGAGAVVLGAWLQQRYQAKASREQKIEDLGRAAADKALAELYSLRRLLMDRSHDEISDWRKTAMQHMDAVELAVGLIPQAQDVRTKVKETMDLTESGAIYALRADLDLNTELLHMFGGCNEAIEIVSAFMRGDPIPEPSMWVKRRKEEERRGEGRHWPRPAFPA